MNKILLGAAAIVIALCVATPASADDFSGLYIGANVGTGSAVSTAQTTTVFSPSGYFAASSVPAINTAGNQDLAPGGGNAGGQIGYNWQSGHTVFGIEAEYSAMNLHGSNTSTVVYPCCAPTNFTIKQTIDTNSLVTIRPRLGITAGHTLFYVTGGWARTNVKYNAVFTDTFAPAHESASSNQSLSGWSWGGGAELKLGKQLSVRGEYLHTNFGSFTPVTTTNLTAFSPAIPFPTNVFTHTMSNLKTDLFRLGLNIRL
jgi:outer membrane immunogenic protein